MNADTYQQGWIEWKTKSYGKKACRFRYWVRDESKPDGWRKAATPWEEGMTEKQAKKRLRDLMTAMEHEPPKAPPVVVTKGLTLQEFVESHWVRSNGRTSIGMRKRSLSVKVFGEAGCKIQRRPARSMSGTCRKASSVFWRSISKPAKISEPTISYFVDPMMIRARLILTI